MIRINLLPAKRGRRNRTVVASPTVAAGGGAVWFGLMFLVWLGLGAVGAWLVIMEDSAAEEHRAKASNIAKEAKEQLTDIDEGSLETEKAQVEQMELAIKKLQEQRRTPAFVLYELSMILTDTKDGGGPDVDIEKHRQMLKQDPLSQINERWDPTGLWLKKVEEEEGVLRIEGRARDAADASEFVRRLRASARFGQVGHLDYQRSTQADERTAARYLDWTVDVSIRRWN